MPTSTTLTPVMIQACDQLLRHRGLIAPNKAILAAIIFMKPELMSSLCKRGLSTQRIKLDSYEQEFLMEALAQHYCRMSWPRARRRGIRESLHVVLDGASKPGRLGIR